MPVSHQVELLANCIENDPNLKDGFIVLPMSQGGVIMRDYVESYNHIKPKAVRFVGISNP